jgi:hypothetical protein
MSETTEAKSTVPSSMWKNRISLVIPRSQVKRFNKGKRALVMKDGQLYEITKKADVELFDAGGKKLNIKQIKALLRRA